MSNPVPKVAPWEDVVLRIIAIYKFTKAFLALAVGLALFHLIHRDVGLFLKDYIIEPLHLNSDSDSENHFVKWTLDYADTLTPHFMRLSSYYSFFYAIVFSLEGTGLYLKKRWGEYMVIIVTGSFLPIEIHLLFMKIVWWKIGLILGNLLIIGYLVHRLRLDYLNKKALRLAEEERTSTEERQQSRAATTHKTAASEVP